MSFTNYLIAAIGSIAIGWYYICLFYVGFIHPQPDAAVSEAFRQFMATSLDTLSGTLATLTGRITIDVSPSAPCWTRTNNLLIKSPLVIYHHFNNASRTS